jgi:mRNA-degrading endonuclease toxin of MazEF toxin-antitoxin module
LTESTEKKQDCCESVKRDENDSNNTAPPPDPLDIALAGLKTAILNMPSKTQTIIIDWIIKWSRYLRLESTFKPEYIPRYKRGDIVYVDFGFNVGNEYGGIHYAAVLEVHNHKGNGNIIIIPLTSLDTDKTKDDVPSSDLYLGSGIIPWTQADTVAKPSQIRAISKIRIIKPLKKADKWVRLTETHLNLIDHRIKQTILRPPPKEASPE